MCWRPGQLQVAAAEVVVGKQEAALQEVALEEVAGSHLGSLRREEERCREREEWGREKGRSEEGERVQRGGQ